MIVYDENLSSLTRPIKYGKVQLILITINPFESIMPSSYLNEKDTRRIFIDPQLTAKDWKKGNNYAIEYKITDGKITVKGKKTQRNQPLRADYALYTDNMSQMLAIIEAKHTHKTLDNGIQQAIKYAKLLEVPYAFASNGSGFKCHNLLTGSEYTLGVDEFPTPAELWDQYVKDLNLSESEQAVIKQPYNFRTDKPQTPRYYQRLAIEKTVTAVARGQKRLLLVMATGTGKTYTAFQIIWRLKQAGLIKRVLYLADRNILIDQTIGKDFKPFDKTIVKIENRKIESQYEIYMSLYHQLSSDDGKENYKAFSPEFFDLIVVDECHRGSAKEDSNWRKILTYFEPAYQLGLTATPKETEDISNITYFGQPLYTYTLKQGIDDGFLAPYSVIRLITDKDTWTPEDGQKDRFGQDVEQREYNVKDLDRNLVLSKRDEMVAKRVTEWLYQNGRHTKTIVFCVDIEHAERMRTALINQNQDMIAKEPNYIMKITGDDKEGKAQLENFIHPEVPYPTIVTTSKLLTTGVDCKTCGLIVLESNIQSMTEFKQIIGRGTRVDEEHGKMDFTIMDFRGVTRLFADKDFDGEPVVIFEPPIDEPLPPTEPPVAEPTGEPPIDDPFTGGDDGNNVEGETGGAEGGESPQPPEPPEPEPPKPPRLKTYIDDVEVTIYQEYVQIIGADGKLVTQNFLDYSKTNIYKQFATLDSFIQAWFDADKKQAIIDELEARGVMLDILEDLAGRKDLDPFDLITHIAYDVPPLSRAERANNVQKRDYLNQYNDVCRQVLDKLLDKYKNDGLWSLEQALDSADILKTSDFMAFGTPAKIAREFGGRDAYFNAVRELENSLYRS